MGNKTIVGFLLVAALICVMAVPAFAESPSAEAAEAVDSTGEAVEVTTSTDVDQAIVDNAVAQLGPKGSEKMQVVDIAISGGKPPYKISIPAATATAALIYHYVDGAWSALETWIEDGVIYAWANSASPFAVVYSDVEGAIIEPPAGIETEIAIVKGDLINSGKPTIGSFALLGSYLLKTATLTDYQLAAADMNGDGTVGLGDFALLGAAILSGK